MGQNGQSLLLQRSTAPILKRACSDGRHASSFLSLQQQASRNTENLFIARVSHKRSFSSFSLSRGGRTSGTGFHWMSWKKGEGGRQVRRRCERGAARWRGRSTSLGGVGGGDGSDRRWRRRRDGGRRVGWGVPITSCDGCCG